MNFQNAIGADRKTIERVIDAHFPQMVSEEMVAEKAAKLRKRKYGVSKIYKDLRSMDIFGSFPDHMLLTNVVEQFGGTLSEQSIRNHYFRLLDRAEYSEKDIRAILRTSFPKKGSKSAK